MWDTQEESKAFSSFADTNITTSVLQSTTSLSTLNSNSSATSPLINSNGGALTPTPSIAIIPQTQQAQQQQQQSQLSLSLPSSLLQSSVSLLQSSQAILSSNPNASTSTLASIASQNPGYSNSNNLSSSLTSNELHTRFDMWAECLAELFVYKNVLQAPLTRIEAWRMVFYRLNQLFPFVDPR
jgi:hypothetical protein